MELAVLVIDDDEGVRTALRTYLVRSGYQVHEADTGRGGLDAVPSWSPTWCSWICFFPTCTGSDVIGHYAAPARSRSSPSPDRPTATMWSADSRPAPTTM